MVYSLQLRLVYLFKEECLRLIFTLLQADDPFVLWQAQIGKMGTLMGVFVPCLQNILGIIFYIRFTW